jgi:hypothetical protein
MTLDQSSQYWPIVLRLAQQGEVSRAIFSMEFEGLSNTSAPTQSNSFDYTSDMGLLTIGDYPEGYTCVSPFLLSFANFIADTARVSIVRTRSLGRPSHTLLSAMNT